MKTHRIGLEYFPSGRSADLGDSPWLRVLTVDGYQEALPTLATWRLTDLRTDAFRALEVQLWLDRASRRADR